jgi:hypothetical protein
VAFNSAVVAAGTSVLRRWSVDDGRWYVDQLSDTEIQRFTTESVDTTVEQFHAALRMLTEADEQFGRAIVDSESGEVAGNLAAGREADVANRVSAATGFVRDPARDKVILVRGKEWSMQAYVRRLRIANG